MTNAVGSAYGITAGTTTSSSMYITAANISTSTIAITQQPPVKRFIPMKRHVDTQQAQYSQHVSLRVISTIEDYKNDIPSLYYVQNNYDDDGFSGQSVTLFRFAIIRETRCYYILKSGQRIDKRLKGRTFGATPTEALGKAIERGNNYLEILIRRGKNVAQFLGEVSGAQGKQHKELREFSKIVEQLKNPDQVPSLLFQKFTKDPNMFEDDI